MTKFVNLAEKLASFATHWDPKIIGELNGQHVKLVKFQGDFVWHSHEAEDELFLVLSGSFDMLLRDRTVTVRKGELIIVPRRYEEAVQTSHSPAFGAGCIQEVLYHLWCMWGIYEHRRVDRRLSRLPTDVLKGYEKWKDIVRVSGPQGLRHIKGFQDEASAGQWKGHRSSRLNRQFRVVCRVKSQRVLVEVVSVTAHDYKRK